MKLPSPALMFVIIATIAGCDNPRPRLVRLASEPSPVSAAQATPLRPSLAAVPETALGVIQWDAAKSLFVAKGQPLRAERLWTFDGTTDGFVVSNGVGIPSAKSGLEVSEADPDVIVRSPKGLQINGRTRSLVIVRLTRTQSGSAWDGALYYSTAAHGEDQRYYAKPISGRNPRLNETVIFAYDMHRLRAGADDWKMSVIDQLRMDLDDVAGGAFTIHQVAVANDPGDLFGTDTAALQAKPVP